MKFLIGTMLINIFTFSLVMSQDYIHDNGLRIGEKFNAFGKYDKKNEAFFKHTLTSFKGKYIVLDFFSAGCAGCFMSFPKIKALQDKFNNNIQFVFVGHEDKNGLAKRQYEIYRKALNLSMPVVFDSIFSNYAVPFAFPHVVWIDSTGTIKAISLGKDITEENIKKFISNEKFYFHDDSHAFFRKSHRSESNLKNDWQYIYSPNGTATEWYYSDTNTVFRSDIGKWKTGYSHDALSTIKVGPNAFQAINGVGSLESLFRFAYVGKQVWMYPDNPRLLDNNIVDTSELYYRILYKIEIESSDSSKFFGKYPDEENLYWYKLLMKTNNRNDSALLCQMQKDLKNSFGFEGSFSTKKVKYFRLTCSDKAMKLLKTRGGKQNIYMNKAEIIVQNVPMATFTNILLRQYLAINSKYFDVYIDETNIQENIDISLQGALYDRSEVKKYLRKYGLDIVEGERLMKVLTIRKASPEIRAVGEMQVSFKPTPFTIESFKN